MCRLGLHRRCSSSVTLRLVRVHLVEALGFLVSCASVWGACGLGSASLWAPLCSPRRTVIPARLAPPPWPSPGTDLLGLWFATPSRHDWTKSGRSGPRRRPPRPDLRRPTVVELLHGSWVCGAAYVAAFVDPRPACLSARVSLQVNGSRCVGPMWARSTVSPSPPLYDMWVHSGPPVCVVCGHGTLALACR